MNEIVGNVIGAEYPDSIFIARDEGKEIWLGDILKIIDIEKPQEEYLIRVSGAQQPPSPDSEMISRRILKDPAFSKIAQSRGSRDIYIGILLCAFHKDENDMKKPYIPKRLPNRHSTVVLPDKNDFAFIDQLATKDYDIPVGTLRVRGDYQPIVRLKGADLPRHIGVYAITGKGKTGFTKVLIYQIAINPEQKYSALVFDAHDEYYSTIEKSLRGLKDAGLPTIHYFNLHDEKTLKISPSQITPGNFKMIYQEGLSAPQEEAIHTLYNYYGAEWLVRCLDLQSQDEATAPFLKGLGIRKETFDVLKRRITLLLNLAIFQKQAIQGDLIYQITNLLDQGNVCIINTRVLTDQEERALLSILTEKILNGRKNLLDLPDGSKQLASKPILLIVVEEALSILGAKVLKGGSNIFADLTREGRKYRIGLLTVVQIPHRLDPDVASNINTNVILGLAQSKSRQAVADNSMDDMDPLVNEMKMLDIGEALISYPHKGEVPFPLPVKITYFNDLLEEVLGNKETKPRVSKHLK